MVARHVQDPVLRRTDLVDPAIADMSRKTAACVEFDERECRAHLLYILRILGIQSIVGGVQGGIEVRFAKESVFPGMSVDILRHDIADRLRSDFAGGMSAHPVTQDEQAAT